MLPALLDEERQIIGQLGFALTCAAIAIVPLTVPSSFSAGAATTSATPAAHISDDLGRLTFPSVALGRDPFVPDAAFAATSSGGEPRRGAGSVLRAIVSGPQPRALIETAGVVRVVGIGDTIGTATVTAIDSNEVILSNGTRLPLAVDRQ